MHAMCCDRAKKIIICLHVSIAVDFEIQDTTFSNSKPPHKALELDPNSPYMHPHLAQLLKLKCTIPEERKLTGLSM